MAINRAPYDALIDDDGSGTTGTPWNKTQIKNVLLDPIDAAILPSMPGGATTQVQFNDAGTLGGDSGLTFDKATDALTIAGDVVLAGGVIRRNTADGADTGSLALAGGGARDSARGGWIRLWGNEGAGTGSITIAPGNVAGTGIALLRGDTVNALTIDGTTGNTTMAGVLTVNGFGTHTFSAGTTGVNSLVVRNTAAGTGNYAQVQVGNDANEGVLRLMALASTYSGWAPANSAIVYAAQSGGLTIAAGDGAGAIRFMAGGTTEYARFPPTGGLYLGTTTAGGGVGVLTLWFNSDTQWGVNLRNTASGNGNHVLFQNSAGGILGSIQQSGQSAIVYNTTSDQRLKTDHGRATDVTGLRGVIVHDFAWTADGTTDRGVFAQEAHAVFPRAISVGDDSATAEGHLARPWMADYSKFVPDLIVGWQQHDATLETLAARVAALEQRI